MIVQQDQLNPTNTSTTFETFNADLGSTDFINRVLHNGTDILKASFYNPSTKLAITPKFKYYQTNGVEKVSYTPQYTNLIDVTYDVTNNKYYTIRFVNDVTLTGIGPDPDDDFSVPSGSVNLDSSKWNDGTTIALTAGNIFNKSITTSGLAFSVVATADIYKEARSKYKLAGDFESQIDFTVTTLTGTRATHFGIDAFSDTLRNLKYGVGITASGGSNLYYRLLVNNFVNSTNNASLTDLYINPSVIQSGTSDWTLTYLGSNSWQLISSYGANNTATISTTTDVLFANTLTSNTGLAFKLNPGSAQLGDAFSFTTKYNVINRASTSGSINIARGGNTFSSSNDGSFNEVIDSENVTLRMKGFVKQSNTVNVGADNFQLTTGLYDYPGYPFLRIEKVDEQGQVLQTIVNTFDTIKDSTVVYSGITNGSVQIAVNASEIMFAKVYDRVYRFSVASPIGGIVDSGTVGVSTSTSGTIPTSGVTSFQYNDSGSGALNYVTFDSNTLEVRYKSISTGSPPTAQAREAFLNIPDWQEHQNNNRRYHLFLHGTDNNSLFYLRRTGANQLDTVKLSSSATGVFTASAVTDSSQNFNTLTVKKGDWLYGLSSSILNQIFMVSNVNSNTSLSLTTTSGTATAITPGTYTYKILSNADLLQFNIDPDISAFSSINSDDYSLQAGTGDTANIDVEVINAWGEALNGKTVTFQITSGDGVINPPSAVTSGSGLATSQYTAGATAGTVQLQVTVSD